MRVNQERMKKFILLTGIVGLVSISYVAPLKAQGQSEAYLQQIAQNTLGILQKVNDLPKYIQSASQFLNAWMNPDNSDTTSAIQSNFTQLGNLLTQDMSAQTSLQTSLNSALLNNDGKNVFNANNAKPGASGLANATTLWYANDLVYSTLLNAPYFPKDPRTKDGQPAVDSALNYLKNASGLNIYHILPGSNWQGSTNSQARYQTYFNTITAAESFGAYVLSNQYADKNQFNTLQTSLIQQASDPAKWFAQVGSENIGFVLRQILLYQSQVFVLLTQLIQLQKQTVSAQVMTNSVLIAVNQINENMLAAYAKGEQPKL